MISKTKELVVVREKPMKNGGASLFLDYTIDGMRTKEYLKMYLIPEKTKIDKIQNQETLRTANAIKAKRTIEIQNGQAGFAVSRNVKLLDFLYEQRDFYKSQNKTSYSLTIGKIAHYIKAWNENVTLKAISPEKLIDFYDFLRGKKQKMNGERKLAESTIGLYHSTLGTLFNTAKRKKLISTNPCQDMDLRMKPHPVDKEREYLTYEEVQRMIKAPCGNETVKQAFLFSCFTGLRISDIEQLDWNMIRRGPHGYELSKKMEKPGKYLVVPLSENAMQFLPEMQEKGLVWPQMPCRAMLRVHVLRWTKAAGITKHITFHCARHTFATMMLTYGADLYTVSKLLGHSDISITQVYAKIVDEKKTEAVSLIPRLG